MQYFQLPKIFFERDTHAVAKDLLGKLLVRTINTKHIIGRITEVESYVGENDKACHAAKGKTKRNEVMFGHAGHAYVYLIYGMYNCFNVVTEEIDFPAAVLIRSLEPVSGLALMQKHRGGIKDKKKFTTGPGRLCQALAIDRTVNGNDLINPDELFVADDGFQVATSAIATSPRVGVAYAGDHANLPWRYYLKDSDFISG